MKNMMFKAAISMTAATLGTTAVALAPVEAASFDLRGSFGVESSFSYAEDGIGLTVTGLTASGPRNVVRSGAGLGVFGGLGDSFQVDGDGPNEGLKFLFDHTVSLVSATFSLVGSNDDFTLFVDGDRLVRADIPGGDFLEPNFGTFKFDSFSPNNEGSMFTFAARGNDDFKLKRINVEKVDVPEPALMLGLGTVAAAGLLAQKRSRKETA